MELTIHESGKRGFADHGWLKTYHSFSFADYYNAEKMNFGKLRVLNDDEVAPGKGFALHSHKDMEIITIPLQGMLKHSDNMLNEQIISAGEVQVMSAGTGIQHAEYNASKTEPVNFLQIWIFTDQPGHKPRYSQKKFSPQERKNNWHLLVSPDGRKESLRIHQNAFISAIETDMSEEVFYTLNAPENGVYIMVIEGSVSIEGKELNRRDAAAILKIEKSLLIHTLKPAYLLSIEVPNFK